MKHLMIATVLATIAMSATAEMTEHEYTAEVGGLAGCKLPKDASKPRTGECEVRKAIYKTGTEIIKVGDQCQEHTARLVSMKKGGIGPNLIDLPQIEHTIRVVDCPA